MNYDDFKCPCCGKCEMDQVFVKKLRHAESMCPVEFEISSGYRCPVHNAKKKVGGSPTSSHLKGLAADIKAENSWVRYHILSALIRAGFERIGIKKTFIHVDDDQSKPKELVWLK